MFVLAIILLIMGVALLKEGSADAAKVGVIVLLFGLFVVLKGDYSFLTWFGGWFVSLFTEAARVVCLIGAMIFLGPILLLFGSKK